MSKENTDMKKINIKEEDIYVIIFCISVPMLLSIGSFFIEAMGIIAHSACIIFGIVMLVYLLKSWYFTIKNATDQE